MAPKRPLPKEDPPPAPASSEEEDEENSSASEDDDEASSDEERPPQGRTVALHSQGQSEKPAVQKSDSDSDSDMPPESTAVIHKVKPSSSAAAASTPKKGNETERDAKRQKKAEGNGKDEDTDTPRVLFQRVWGESDEIAVLNGLIEFAEMRGADPLKHMSDFYDFIKKSLHVDVSAVQLKDKVHRLRKKFKNHVTKKDGLDKRFTKAHDQKMFDLSKKIWYSQGQVVLLSKSKVKKEGGSSSKSASKRTAGNGGGEERMEFDDQNDGFSLNYWSLLDGAHQVEGFLVKKGLDMVQVSKRNELGGRWKELGVAALELFVQRNQLITDHAEAILDSKGRS